MSELNIVFKTWPFEHQFEGESEPRRWDLPRPKKSTQLAYAKHIERLMVLGVERHRDVMDNVAHRAAMDSIVQGFATGKYNWKRPLFWETLASDDNRRELVWVWFTQAEMGVAKKLTRQQFDLMWEAKRDELYSLLEAMLTEENPTQN